MSFKRSLQWPGMGGRLYGIMLISLFHIGNNYIYTDNQKTNLFSENASLAEV